MLVLSSKSIQWTALSTARMICRGKYWYMMYKIFFNIACFIEKIMLPCRSYRTAYKLFFAVAPPPHNYS